MDITITLSLGDAMQLRNFIEGTLHNLRPLPEDLSLIHKLQGYIDIKIKEHDDEVNVVEPLHLGDTDTIGSCYDDVLDDPRRETNTYDRSFMLEALVREFDEKA